MSEMILETDWLTLCQLCIDELGMTFEKMVRLSEYEPETKLFASEA